MLTIEARIFVWKFMELEKDCQCRRLLEWARGFRGCLDRLDCLVNDDRVICRGRSALA
jgi:hypothetical protein